MLKLTYSNVEFQNFPGADPTNRGGEVKHAETTPAIMQLSKLRDIITSIMINYHTI